MQAIIELIIQMMVFSLGNLGLNSIVFFLLIACVEAISINVALKKYSFNTIIITIFLISITQTLLWIAVIHAKYPQGSGFALIGLFTAALIAILVGGPICLLVVMETLQRIFNRKKIFSHNS